jgi:hypothetical protein
MSLSFLKLSEAAYYEGTAKTTEAAFFCKTKKRF